MKIYEGGTFREKDIGSVNAMYPLPAVVVGAMVDGKSNWMLAGHVGIMDYKHIMVSIANVRTTKIGIEQTGVLSVNMVDEALLPKADYVGTVPAVKGDKSAVFDYTIGETGAPLISASPVVMECKVEDHYDIGVFRDYILTIEHFSLAPILVFGMILTLFGAYVVQIHYLVEHEQRARALRLMYTHYFIVISLNLVTVTLNLLREGAASPLFLRIVMICALAVFFAMLSLNACYYKPQYHLSRKDIVTIAAGIVVGATAMFVVPGNRYGLLLGALLTAITGFTVFLQKYQSANRPSASHS